MCRGQLGFLSVGLIFLPQWLSSGPWEKEALKGKYIAGGHIGGMC